eukprot:TRINITY_DN36969_c0_g2_i1.p1 TRINITY_DN36969_c0_g2~~TRINITY_DN36969_c0_g2_i1.p1  ORF type:complete len:285 (-),score=39.75 TRINITY_DN36969_c0_g2_i1:100-915(-)
MILPSALESALSARGELCLLLGRACTYTCLFAATHLALRPVVRRTSIEPRYRCDWINRVLASGHAIVSGIAGMWSLCTEAPFSSVAQDVLRFQVTDSVQGSSVILQQVLPFTMGYFAYDCGVMAIDDEVYMPLMVVHHVISLAIWPISFLNQAGTFYVIYFLATELSTPLLHLTVFFLPKHGVQGASRTIVGLVLILVFFLVRVLPSPALLYSLRASAASGYWSSIPSFVTILAMFTIPVPPFLFAYWFFKLVRGALKALGSDDSDNEKKD